MPIKAILKRTFPTALRHYRKWKFHRASQRVRPYRTEWGFTLNGDLSHAMGFGRADHNRIRSGEVEVFEKLFPLVDTFVDVGANIGLYTLLAGHHNLQCIAVEPSPRNFKYLIENLTAANQCDTEIFNLALGSKPGFSILCGDGEMASLNNEWNPATASTEQPIAINTLDTLCGHRFADRQLLIKIDVEGHELPVMKGAQLLVAKSPAPIWVIEHTTANGSTMAGEDPLFRTMLAAGYSIIPLATPATVITATSDTIRTTGTDFVFIQSADQMRFKQVTSALAQCTRQPKKE